MVHADNLVFVYDLLSAKWVNIEHPRGSHQHIGTDQQRNHYGSKFVELKYRYQPPYV